MLNDNQASILNNLAPFQEIFVRVNNQFRACFKDEQFSLIKGYFLGQSRALIAAREQRYNEIFYIGFKEDHKPSNSWEIDTYPITHYAADVKYKNHITSNQVYKNYPHVRIVSSDMIDISRIILSYSFIMINSLNDFKQNLFSLKNIIEPNTAPIKDIELIEGWVGKIK